MTAISASQVKELRDRTGAGMMDCKAALQETDGDIEKAVELLRVRLGDKALKVGDREATVTAPRVPASSSPVRRNLPSCARSTPRSATAATRSRSS